MFYVYILKSKLNGEIYTGSTNDLKNRLKEHNAGNVRSTDRYKPWSLIYYEAYVEEKLARLRESRLKHDGNAIKELKKRIGFIQHHFLRIRKSGTGLSSTTFLKKLQKSGAGFTIFELLLSISILAILAGILAPVYQSFQVKNDLDVAVNVIVVSLRRAEILSQAVDGDSSWGVTIQPAPTGASGPGSIVLFKGVSSTTRDATLDEIFDLPSTITPSGVKDIVFNKFSGFPQTTGTTTLTTSTNEVRNININDKGTINY